MREVWTVEIGEAQAGQFHGTESNLEATTGVIQGVDSCLLCRWLFVRAVGTEQHLAKTPKWPLAQVNHRYRLTCADS
jgi:hypothetical protein